MEVNTHKQHRDISLAYRQCDLRESKTGTEMPFMDLASEVRKLYLYHILLEIQVSPIHCGRGLPKGTNTRR